MSEFSLAVKASKKTNAEFSSLVLSDFMLFCSFVLSHPLYFSYLIFFAPYMFKVFSFLSPLFITTSLFLILTLFTFTPRLVNDISHLGFSESKASFFLTTYQTLVERLRSKVDDERDDLGCLEELEVYMYKMVFEGSSIEIRENPDELLELEREQNCPQAVEALRSSSSDSELEATQKILGEKVKSLEGFLQEEKQEFESLSCQKEEKEVKPLSAESDKGEEKEEQSSMRSGSSKISEAKAMVNFERLSSNNSIDGEYNSKVKENYEALGGNLGSFGSMRKEKEWKRTLACKLFEERHNGDGSEGMDLLWETYENDSNKMQLKKSSSKKGKKGGKGKYYDDDEDAEDYEDEADGQLCCLQALKFSAGKMNLGMGRPNLVKISKALKGIGWWHHVSSRHAKKGYR